MFKRLRYRKKKSPIAKHPERSKVAASLVPLPLLASVPVSPLASSFLPIQRIVPSPSSQESQPGPSEGVQAKQVDNHDNADMLSDVAPGYCLVGQVGGGVPVSRWAASSLDAENKGDRPRMPSPRADALKSTTVPTGDAQISDPGYAYSEVFKGPTALAKQVRKLSKWSSLPEVDHVDGLGSEEDHDFQPLRSSLTQSQPDLSAMQYQAIARQTSDTRLNLAASTPHDHHGQRQHAAHLSHVPSSAATSASQTHAHQSKPSIRSQMRVEEVGPDDNVFPQASVKPAPGQSLTELDAEQAREHCGRRRRSTRTKARTSHPGSTPMPRAHQPVIELPYHELERNGDLPSITPDLSPLTESDSDIDFHGYRDQMQELNLAHVNALEGMHLFSPLTDDGVQGATANLALAPVSGQHSRRLSAYKASTFPQDRTRRQFDQPFTPQPLSNRDQAYTSPSDDTLSSISSPEALPLEHSLNTQHNPPSLLSTHPKSTVDSSPPHDTASYSKSERQNGSSAMKDDSTLRSVEELGQSPLEKQLQQQQQHNQQYLEKQEQRHRQLQAAQREHQQRPIPGIIVSTPQTDLAHQTSSDGIEVSVDGKQIKISHEVDSLLTALAEQAAKNLQAKQHQHQEVSGQQLQQQAHQVQQTPLRSDGVVHSGGRKQSHQWSHAAQTGHHSDAGGNESTFTDESLLAIVNSAEDLKQNYSTGNHGNQGKGMHDQVALRRLEELVQQLYRYQKRLIHRQQHQDDRLYRVKSERLQLRKENEELQKELKNISLRAVARQEEAKQTLRTQETTYSRERKASCQVQQELKEENKRLHQLLQSLQETGISSPERQNYEQLRRQVEEYQLIIYRLNTELAQLQDSNVGIEVGLSTPTRLSRQTAPWLADTKRLCPLLTAYDQRLAEKDKALHTHEEHLVALKRRVAEILHENEQLRLASLEQREASAAVVGQEDWKLMEEHKQLLADENNVLLEQQKLLQARLAHLESKHKKSSSHQQRILQSVESARQQLQKDFTELGKMHSELRTVHEALVAEHHDFMPRSEHTRSVLQCKENLKATVNQHKEKEKDLQQKIAALEKSNHKLIEQLTEATGTIARLEEICQVHTRLQKKWQSRLSRNEKQLQLSYQQQSQLQHHLRNVVVEADNMMEERQNLVKLVVEERRVHQHASQLNSHELSQLQQRLKALRAQAHRKVEKASRRLVEQEEHYHKQQDEFQHEVRHLQRLLQTRQQQLQSASQQKREAEQQLELIWTATASEQQHLHSGLTRLAMASKQT